MCNIHLLCHQTSIRTNMSFCAVIPHPARVRSPSLQSHKPRQFITASCTVSYCLMSGIYSLSYTHLGLNETLSRPQCLQLFLVFHVLLFGSLCRYIPSLIIVSTLPSLVSFPCILVPPNENEWRDARKPCKDRRKKETITMHDCVSC